VPLYFVVGGAAGTASVIAWVATLAGDAAGAAMARDARAIAAAGAVISPALLVSDLGRPSRFLNMLRVAKRQSAMSVGAWTLVIFQAAALAALVLHAWPDAAGGLAGTAAPVAGAAAAASGLVLATYTGVLLGATAIPVWAAHARLLPLHFGGSSLGVAAGLLELFGHRTHTVNVIGAGAAIVVLLTAIASERDRRRSTAPLRSGTSGALVRTGDLLAGPVALLLRATGASSATLRVAAAIAAIAGSVCVRYGWVAAGRVSAADPRVILDEDAP
jgi:formate-dependent nitrite reductase membrane component NrfD